jgi:hypothetical protein
MTPQELQFAALRETGVVAADETPSAEQGVFAQARYANLHAMLLRMGLATWALTEDIPDAYALPVTWMLAFHCCAGETLGVVPSIRKDMAVLGSLGSESMSVGERQLRDLLAADYVSQPAQAEYF